MMARRQRKERATVIRNSRASHARLLWASAEGEECGMGWNGGDGDPGLVVYMCLGSKTGER
jgi:hypothetical protein